MITLESARVAVQQELTDRISRGETPLRNSALRLVQDQLSLVVQEGRDETLLLLIACLYPDDQSEVILEYRRELNDYALSNYGAGALELVCF